MNAGTNNWFTSARVVLTLCILMAEGIFLRPYPAAMWGTLIVTGVVLVPLNLYVYAKYG